MKNISVKGVVLGVIAVVLVDVVGGILGIVLFAPDMSEESLNALGQDQSFLLWSLFAGTFSTILGGFLAAFWRQKSANLRLIKTRLLLVFWE